MIIANFTRIERNDQWSGSLDGSMGIIPEICHIQILIWQECI
jgi:hypothetical protein